MSKDIVIAIIMILIGAGVWSIAEFWHNSHESLLPVSIETYLEEINPNLDLQGISR